VATLSISRTISLLAEQDPDRPAITFEGRTVTRRELDQRTNRLARAYEALGVGQDDLVTIALPNGIEFYEAAIATWKLGATPQPVSAKLPEREREAIVELADPPVVVGAEPGSHGDRAALPAGFEPDPALSDEPLPDRSPASWKAPTSGGSTGRPKIILAGDGGRLDPEAVPGSRMQRDGVQLVPGPLYHNGPFVFSMRGLLHGNHLVVHRRFDAAATLADIGAHGVDWVLLVPTMMHRIMRLPEEQRLAHDLSSLQTVLHLGAPCPPWLKEAWIEWLGGERICELYAGTEAQGVTWITGDEWLEHRGSVGRPIGGSQMRILDPEGEDLPPGEVGEVFMRPAEGSGPTYRYIGAEARERDGWESLGDLGWLDDDGYLYLADRSADLILSGGANVYPAEIEAALDEHPLVRSSAVIGLPDDDLGERVHALLDLTGEVSDDDLRAHLAERLVRYKVPRTFERVEEPLRDDAGKVRRSALRSERLSPPPG
jgi:bile acid-coenzyme A ligase